MKYQENLSGWKKALLDQGIGLKVMGDEDRITSIKRLINSGLPGYCYHFFSMEEYLAKKESIDKIYRDYSNNLVTRACPGIKALQRYTYIKRGYSFVADDLALKINEEDRKNYTVVLNEHEPDARYCGVIISKKEGLLIELVAEPTLENLCHGHVVPWSAEFKKGIYGHSRMVYKNVDSEEVKEVMFSVVKSISEESYDGMIPEYKPIPGYFEFLISADGGLKFIDYGHI